MMMLFTRHKSWLKDKVAWLVGQKGAQHPNGNQKSKLLPLLAILLVLAVLWNWGSGAYRDYVIRSQVQNWLPMANDAKKSVEWYLKNQGVLPICNTHPEIKSNTVGFSEIAPGSVKTVNRMWLNYNCVIEIRGESKDLNQDLPGTLSLVLCPTLQQGEVKWDCLYYDSNAEKGPWMKYVPKECQRAFFWNGNGMQTCGH